MTFATKADLKTNVLDFMARNDLSGKADDFITLAEAGLNRELGVVETDTSLTGTIDDDSIDISSISLVEPLALLLAEVGCDEQLLTPKTNGTYPRHTLSGRPRYYSVVGESIVFDRPLDAAYPFRFFNRQRFALANDGDTNWLLENHPDVYLAAVIVWGFVFRLSAEKTAFYEAVLSKTLPGVKREIARKKRAVLTVDPMLQRIGHRVWGNQWANE